MSTTEEPEARPAAPERLNVLVVAVGATRNDHLHYAGYERETTPHLDEFAGSALHTLAHVSHSSRTGPAVASIFTGRLPGSHGLVNSLVGLEVNMRLGDEEVTMAERFKDAGYLTLGVVTNREVSDQLGFDQGFDVYEYFEEQDHGRRVNREAFELLDGRDATDEPFFMYLHYMNPHSSYEPDPAFRGLFADPGYAGELTGSSADLGHVVAGRQAADDAYVEHIEALYDEEIRTFDERFGELLDGLGERHLRGNTIIVFISDHGEEFLEHGSVSHGYTLYGEQLRVPFLIYDPRHSHRRAATVVSRHIDVLPTLLSIAGLDPEAAAEGESVLSDEPGTSSDSPFRDAVGMVQNRALKTVRLRSLLHERWTLIVEELPVERVQLFNAAEDISESQDLAEDRPDKVAELLAILDAIPGARFDVEVAGDAEAVQLSDEERQALLDLGLSPPPTDDAEGEDGEAEAGGEGEGED